MHHFRDYRLMRLVGGTFLLLGLLACERDTYTSWTCAFAHESKIPMVLRKARMEFKGENLYFCGSLGHQSYFDHQCPVQTEQSRVIFAPSTGMLRNNGQEYQCTAL